jgi:hypothetical protein
MTRAPTLDLLGATAIAAFFTGLLFLVCALIPNTAQAGEVDQRYCYAITDIPRDLQGRIIRSSKPVYVFRLAHPCPVTFKKSWCLFHVNLQVQADKPPCCAFARLKFSGGRLAA